MKIISIILCLALTFLLKSQPPVKFHQTFGSAGIDIGYGVLETLDKQYLILGSTSSYGSGNTDIILIKVDTMGNVLWSRNYGGMQNDCGKALVQLADSSIVFTGFTNSYGNGGYDALVIKTDKFGNQQWMKTFGGQDWDFGYDIIKMNDGSIVICGKTFSFGNGKSDGMVVKFNSSGTVVWNKYFGGIEDDDFKGIYTKTGNEIYVAGITRSNGEINGDMLMYQLNNSGDSLMRIIYGGTAYDMANDVTIASSNEIVLAGGSNSFSNGKEDAFVARFSSTGTFIRKANFGEIGGNEEVFKIIPANSSFGDVILNYSSDQNQGTGLDFLTLAIDNGLWYLPGGQNGSFGSLLDEEPYDIYPTKDKGYIQVGYTVGFNAVDKDILFVKRDSMMRFGNYLGASPVGMNEQFKSNKTAVLYPNPATNDIRLNVSGPEDFKLVIYDFQGKAVREETISAEKLKRGYDINSLNSGLYLISLSDKNSTYYIKFTKL